jgi:hypothetical protein
LDKKSLAQNIQFNSHLSFSSQNLFSFENVQNTWQDLNGIEKKAIHVARSQRFESSLWSSSMDSIRAVGSAMHRDGGGGHRIRKGFYRRHIRRLFAVSSVRLSLNQINLSRFSVLHLTNHTHHLFLPLFSFLFNF